MSKNREVDLEGLGKSLMIEIPANAFFEFSITALDENMENLDQIGRANVFRGRLTISNGKVVDRRRLTTPIEIKAGIIGSAWPG